MGRSVKLNISLLLFFFLFFLSSSSFTVYSLSHTNAQTGNNSLLPKENPFTVKASLVRYWNKQISNKLPKPDFLFSKASPLSTIDAAFFTNLATQKSLSGHISTFCSSAKLFCFFESKPYLNSSPSKDAKFAVYNNKKFTNYGSSRLGGEDGFKNYSDGVNFATGEFTKYSRSSTGHREGFTSYAADGNVASGNFTSYAAGATGGGGTFQNYMPRVNVPDLRFASYDSDGNNHKLEFTSYVGDTNSGKESFISYAKNGNGVPVGFATYGDTSNVIGSSFNGYGESGNSANDSFTAYSSNSNNPNNNFKNYGAGGNRGVDSFTSYRDSANAGTDMFTSYARGSNSGKVNFLNYGKSFNEGKDTFKGYGSQGAKFPSVGFKVYGVNNSFKEYTPKGVNFAGYTKKTAPAVGSLKTSGKTVNKWVEEGKFFRESMLKEGTVMKMPDIRDKMPGRSFLPRTISSKLPFSTKELSELKAIFNAQEKSTMEHVILNTLAECERAPSPGETKRCVGSVEDMIDFAVSVLGHNVVVRTTDNVAGSKEQVMLGEVKGINGGRVTKSVSCHQSLYPYLLYYCHSVPKVRVYQADILNVETKAKINHGVAICHVDTSSWSPGHGAFVALGSGPGLIEVCHWIFENDMTWATAD
ncbi:polygalacturonase 1 beta-like protein 3 [Lycium barbarum]|uniref:polygalacturonase 1 beta-like protein 3 n=1 Tax=Lycium barbarum TaxID=112863 RepID=UPI00293E8BAD|nr:polygalacturonase 1 beta-like protein 3 [Lycium barbarum]